MEREYWKFPTWGGFEDYVYHYNAVTARLERDGNYVTEFEFVVGVPVITASKWHVGVRCNKHGDVLPTVGYEPTVTGAKKYDANKPMMDLVMHGVPDALLAVGDVLTYGFKKYGGKHGWKSLPDAVPRYEAAMLRHQMALGRGELVDPESNLPHAAHIAANALFLLQFHTEATNATQANKAD